MKTLVALALALTGCGACPTADLEARYAAELALHCDLDRPLAECPDHPALAEKFERDYVERLEAKPCPILK